MNRYKARLVACDFYSDLWSGLFGDLFFCGSSQLYPYLVSLAVNYQWSMFELDVKNAFIYGDLEEEVHMEQSPGNVSLGKNMVCKLYGLKQHL